MFGVPYFIGATLSWTALTRLTLRPILSTSLMLAIASAACFTLVGGMEFPDDIRVAIGVGMTLPIVLLVCSALGLRYAARSCRPYVPE